MVRQIDIFASAGLRNPDISIPSDEFLAEVEGMPQKNLAFELLRKLLNDEIRTRGKRNVVEAPPFKQLLQQAVQKHQNRAVETTEIVRDLIEPAQQMREASRRSEKLNRNAGTLDAPRRAKAQRTCGVRPATRAAARQGRTG